MKDIKIEEAEWDLAENALSEQGSIKIKDKVLDIQTEKQSELSQSIEYDTEKIKKELRTNPLKKEAEKMASKASIHTDPVSNLCGVCCQRECDCVVMPCGHAGICNFCSISIFDKNGKCPICRRVESGLFRRLNRFFRLIKILRRRM